MSWVLSATEIDPQDLTDVLEQMATEYEAQFDDGFSDEVQEQVDAAIECAAILASCVGGEKVNVSINGHANPGHKPHPSYANDTVLVSVTNADQRHLPDVGDEAKAAEASGAAQ